MTQVYCSKCKIEHGNNYFLLVVPYGGSIKAYRQFAEKCGCEECFNILAEIKKSVCAYLKHKSQKNPLYTMWERVYVIFTLRNKLIDVVNSHVVGGCNGVPCKHENTVVDYYGARSFAGEVFDNITETLICLDCKVAL